ncbi:fungal-specific transcription factor domain-containing protein [Annulohypoxylon maeteangense]|uniref:fungal-specific transcription factor domain-containing protein n=1 Tax=Annulohypoxylon maeteangense TaxID=1927788 RepID=UPI002007A55A|nr:fungal-specific transcription factor domain-containing protein [Annulohypoxylon maeteangense]KAI0887588.1 fungal-specific transcription factor domain-containing protein [Annulohypoxylon maeteangense]
MFTTFIGMAPGVTDSSAPSPPETPKFPRRQKRSQVARACDWCRVHRIKCDNHVPCSNCRKRDGQCNQGEVEVRTLPHAFRKIEHLETRIKELERELENERRNTKSSAGHGLLQNRQSSLASSGSSSLGITGVLSPPSDDESSPEKKRSGDGVRIRTARRQETWYGPSSLFYFIRRVNTFLNDSFQQTHPINRMLPDSNKLFDGPAQISENEQSHRHTHAAEGRVTENDYLTPTQEEYFISLFWQSFHTTLPVIDEVAFKEHYQSLWETSSGERKPSALVDIVIALCMQYGMAQQSGTGQANSIAPSPKSDSNGANNTSIAGRWHYQRCQRLLTNELESPTVFTLQCHILSTVYLCAGSFPNMADSTCTLAVRTAYMLGLHLDPPEETSPRERELRKRLWWTLYILESKISMKLGRPFLLDHSDTTCSLPRDDRESVTLSGSAFTPLGQGATWLTFHVENIKLFLAVRAAYTAFYKKQLNTTNNSNKQAPRGESEIIESHAEYLGLYIDRIEEWVKAVPGPLKTKRQDDGTPFSTDFTPLEIEPFASLWLQRQRLLLELMYHNLCINLFRPFIRFISATKPTPTADKTAADCAAHAITLTRIMYQVLSSTTILTGWHESFQWQWNATMSLIGFAIAYPQHASAPEARNAIDMSIAVFEIFERSLPSATSAATIARGLGAQADLLAKKIHGQQDSTSKTVISPPTTGSWESLSEGNIMGSNPITPQTAASIWNSDDGTSVPLQGFWADSIDMALSVDTQDFGILYWPNMNSDISSQWTYPQI